MKKIISITLAAIVTASLIPVSTMAKKVDNSNAAILKPYAQTVNLSIGKFIQTDDKSLVGGDTIENNIMTRFLKQKLNISVNYPWQAQDGDQYEQKCKLAIASGDIPDVMTLNYNDFVMANKAGLIEDLTSVYNNHATSKVKELYASGNNAALKAATFGGKMYAIPWQQAAGDNPEVLWVRQDWLNKLGLKMPKNLSDVEKVAQAFVTRDPDGNGKNDTVGLARSGDVGPGGISFVSVFSAFNAFPDNWIKENGKLTNGSVTPETKDALSLLADWYKKGIIDKDFATRKNPGELVASGKCGLVFAPWWYVWGAAGDAVKNDPKAKWGTTLAALTKAGKFNYLVPAPATRYVVVKKGIKNPEAVMKCIDLEYAVLYDTNFTLDKKDENDMYWPCRTLIVKSDEIEQFSKEIRDALNGKMTGAEIKTKTSWWQTCYQAALKQKTTGKIDLANWANANCYTLGAVPIADANPKMVTKVYNQFVGSTPTMLSPMGQYLTNLQDEYFYKIILGQMPVSKFSEFVVNWYKNGGQKITDEVRKTLGE